MNGYIGRAKTILVFRDGEGDMAFITDVICRPIPNKPGLEFHGPGVFSDKTRSHLEQTAYASVRSIMFDLGLPCPGFMISAVNLGAASYDDRELVVSGFSADTAVILSMLSAALNLPLPTGLVSTGHLASPGGDIRMVGSLPAKLAAAELDSGITTFLMPDIGKDDSLKPLLSESELNAVEAAVAKAKRSLRLIQVNDVTELITYSFTERDMVIAGLRNGYFNPSSETDQVVSSSGAAALILAGDLETKFWSVLEQNLSEGRSDKVTDLLTAYLGHYANQKVYPNDLGKRLHQILISLPPHIRRLKLRFPLLSAASCIELAPFAAENQVDDVAVLLKAINGDGLGRSIPPTTESMEASERKTDGQKLLVVLDMISSDSLAQRIKRPIDNARAAYQLDSVIVDDHEAFNETITSFFIHLIRRVRGLIGPVEPDLSGAEAHALLRRTFNRQGGYMGALAEARSGYKGGLRFILDTVTEQFKNEECEKEVNRILEEALDPLDWSSQVNFMSALIDRLKDHLPPELTDKPVEQYAGHIQELTKAYVDSVDRLNSAFRSL